MSEKWADRGERTGGWLAAAVIVGVLLMVPLGVGLAVWTGDPNWLWLCGVLIFFLS